MQEIKEIQELIIIRGIVGGGKSTFAGKLLEEIGQNKASHYEADNYFMENGVYKFDQSKLGAAHKRCFDLTESALKSGKTAIVSNTFTTQKELNPYLKLAEELSIPVRVYVVGKELTLEELQKRCVHNVPKKTIENMIARWYNYPGEIHVKGR